MAQNKQPFLNIQALLFLGCNHFPEENLDEALWQILKLQLLFQNKKRRRIWFLTGPESLKNHQENVYLVQGLGGGVIPKSTRDNLGKQLVESGESDK